MKKGQIVKVYDGDLVGFTTATLVDLITVINHKDEVLERWSMKTEDGTILVRLVRNSSKATKDGCAYLLDKDDNNNLDEIEEDTDDYDEELEEDEKWEEVEEDNKECKYEKTLYCVGYGESHYDISDEYYIATFEGEDYIDINYSKTPDIEGITIDRKDILKIAEIIRMEDK